MSEYRNGPLGVEDAAIAAARRSGEASAMVINLCMAGQDHRTAGWEAEQEAWTRRQDELVASLPVGRQDLSARIANTVHASFEANVVKL